MFRREWPAVTRHPELDARHGRKDGLGRRRARSAYLVERARWHLATRAVSVGGSDVPARSLAERGAIGRTP
jgi:hypothetical protein